MTEGAPTLFIAMLDHAEGTMEPRADGGRVVDRARAHELRVRGAGPVVVISHGLGGSQEQWEPIAAELAASHTVATFTLAGSPGADPGLFSAVRHSSVFGYADDLIELVTEANLRGAAYVGHSTAGIAGALASAVDPGLFSRLVMIGSSPRYLDDDETGYRGGFDRPTVDGLLDAIEADFSAWAASFSYLMVGVPDRPDLVDAFREHLLRYDRVVAHAAFRAVLTSDVRRFVSRVALPTLLVSTSRDPVVPRSVTEWLAAALPDARTASVPTDGHLPQLTAPAALMAVIGPFLAALPPEG